MLTESIDVHELRRPNQRLDLLHLGKLVRLCDMWRDIRPRRRRIGVVDPRAHVLREPGEEVDVVVLDGVLSKSFETISLSLSHIDTAEAEGRN